MLTPGALQIKERYGLLERIQPDRTTGICRGLFKKETDLRVFTGLRVMTRRGEVAVVEGSFGKVGPERVQECVRSMSDCRVAVAAGSQLLLSCSTPARSYYCQACIAKLLLLRYESFGEMNGWWKEV